MPGGMGEEALKNMSVCMPTSISGIDSIYVIVIPWLQGILLIYTPKARGPQARGLRVYMSAKSQAAMVQVIYITWGTLT